METSKAILDNTVKADHQLPESEYVTFDGQGKGGIKITVVGNSITRHGPKSDIGWYNPWGMAASAREKDYLHILMERTRTSCPDAQFCVVQAAYWERNFMEENVLHYYETAQRFQPDSIILRIGENVSNEASASQDYQKALEQFITYLGGGKAKLVCTTSFWVNPHPDQAMRKLAAKYGAPLIELGQLGEQPEMKAIGLFEHSGVAAHPGDLGMAKIADAIWPALEKLL